MLVSFYLSNFADYNETYGSLGAVIALMMWLWISAMVILIGAELNAELEHQTAEDTTTGRERPIDQRGATMADSVGRSSEGRDRAA
jgi:membrane protein